MFLAQAGIRSRFFLSSVADRLNYGNDDECDAEYPQRQSDDPLPKLFALVIRTRGENDIAEGGDPDEDQANLPEL